MEAVTAEHQVRHVTVSTEMKYESVKTRIEAEVNRLDDSFRQLLAESLTLAIGGGVLGMMLAKWALSLSINGLFVPGGVNTLMAYRPATD